MPPQQQQQMPNDTWPITRDDKVEIQELGRKLFAFLQGEFKDRDQVHLKIVVGAFNYIMDLQTQKTKLIGDDFILADKSVKAAKLEEMVEEPFTVEPEEPEPTLEELIAAKQAELAELEGQREVENASPAPTEGAQPMEGPANEAPAAPVAETPATPEPAAPAAGGQVAAAPAAAPAPETPAQG